MQRAISVTPRFEVGRGKEAQEQVQGLWLYEIAELTHFSKAEVGAIKAFISSKVDRYRVAYGATVSAALHAPVPAGGHHQREHVPARPHGQPAVLAHPGAATSSTPTGWVQEVPRPAAGRGVCVVPAGGCVHAHTPSRKSAGCLCRCRKVAWWRLRCCPSCCTCLTRSPTDGTGNWRGGQRPDGVCDHWRSSPWPWAWMRRRASPAAGGADPQLGWTMRAGSGPRKQINGVPGPGVMCAPRTGRPQDKDRWAWMRACCRPMRPRHRHRCAPPPASSPYTQEGDDAPFLSE